MLTSTSDTLIFGNFRKRRIIGSTQPMPSIGAGVQEIRIRDAAGAFRVIYVAKFADAVYVLHCFRKTTQKTSKTDLDLAAKRYRELIKELGK
jgi:phage-related protein